MESGTVSAGHPFSGGEVHNGIRNLVRLELWSA
jgi:hypothetical protein